LLFALAPWIKIDDSLIFNIKNSSKCYILKGIIYTNGHHFTSRLIDKNFNIWYHDGQTTQSHCQKEQTPLNIRKLNELKTCKNEYQAIIAFYAED
jgi:hypothetical protein